MIKAIETSYKGFRFRSRLEARWAVFFDTLGTKWEYEPEGFDLGDTGWYLPDFFLSDLEVYVEIKPSPPSVIELARIKDLSSSLGIPSFIIAGNPYPEEYNIYTTKDRPGEIIQFALANNILASSNLVIVRQLDKGYRCELLMARKIFARDDFSGSFDWPCTHNQFSKTTKLMKAYNAARSARFEYGECPA